MMKYIFIAPILVFLFTYLVVSLSSDNDRDIKEPFTPFLRQQYRKRARQFRLGLTDGRKRMNRLINRITGRYGLGL